MSDLMTLIESGPANVSVTVSLQDLREAADRFAEQVAERLLGAMPGRGDDELLTANEVCDMLGVTKQTLWRWAKMDYLKTVKVGSAVRYSRADVEEIMSKKTNNIK